MKALKIALLGTAALAAASVSARADALADLKSAILGVDGSYVSATADAPASDTMITWSGRVRVGVVMTNHGVKDTATSHLTTAHDTDTFFAANAKLAVVGKTETAVGEVGVEAALVTSAVASTASPTWNVDGFKGWWKLTPSMKLTAGWDVTPGGLGGYGTDALSANFIGATAPAHPGALLGHAGVRLDHAGGPTAAVGMALGYSDGPISLGVGVSQSAVNPSVMQFGASVGYAADAYKLTAAGWARGSDYQVGLGIGASFDMISLTAAAALNHTGTVDTTILEASAIAKLGDSLSAELGASYTSNGTQNDLGIGGGIYYSPVSQLSIGLEGGYSVATVGTVTDAAHTTAALVTVFKF